LLQACGQQVQNYVSGVTPVEPPATPKAIAPGNPSFGATAGQISSPSTTGNFAIKAKVGISNRKLIANDKSGVFSVNRTQVTHQ